MPNLLTEDHPYPRKLFTIEEIDGPGKSTQLDLLHKWLVSEGYSVFFLPNRIHPLQSKKRQKPNLVIYLKIGLSNDLYENFVKCQTLTLNKFDQMTDEFNLKYSQFFTLD